MTQGSPKTRVVVFISGNGSNLQAIIDDVESGKINADIVGVVSNKSGAYGLTRAENSNIPTFIVEAHKGETREDYDQRLTGILEELQPSCIVLAGFMRILSETFVHTYADKLLNIHPSLLPKYRGLDTHQRAIDAGDTEHGCSVHFVTAELDGGPVILQAKVPVFEDDNVDTLAERVQTQERQIYPLVVKWFCDGRLTTKNQKAVLDGQTISDTGYAAD